MICKCTGREVDPSICKSCAGKCQSRKPANESDNGTSGITLYD